MEQDLATLQSISDTLKEEPKASQRTLAKKAGMSLGLMNAILGRFVERGWIMLTNVNVRKLAYAVTPEGISELSNRSKKFAVRTFSIANEYNNILTKLISSAKLESKRSVTLYGKSYIKFLLIYVCKQEDILFEEKDYKQEVQDYSLCLIGELEDINIQEELIKKGCLNI